MSFERHSSLTDFVVHHHQERNHLGKENLLLFPASEQLHQSEGKVRSKGKEGAVVCEQLISRRVSVDDT